MRRTAALTVAVTVALLGGLATAAPAHAATSPNCVAYTHFRNLTGYMAEVPTEDWSEAKNTQCYMFRGMGLNNSAVKVLQTTLNDCYLYLSDWPYAMLKVDGDFGGNTQRALRFAQGKAGAAQDGEYGPETRRLLLFTSHRGPAGCARVV